MDSRRYLPLFLTEARRQLGAAESVLGTPVGTPGRLETLYRAFHTLKGMCAQMGFARPTLVAHAIEDLLDRVRAGTLPEDETATTLMLDAMDALGRALGAIERGDEEESDQGVEARVLEHLRRATTTTFLIVPEPEPEPEFEPAAPRQDEAIAAIAEILAACQRVRTEMAAVPSVQAELARVEAATQTIYAKLVELRQVTFDTLVPTLRRRMRRICERYEREAHLDLRGETTLVDPLVLEKIQVALLHVVSNAVVHGIEAPETRRAVGKPAMGRVAIHVERTATRLGITITDDGGGFDGMGLREASGRSDLDAVGLAFLSGVSTATEVDETAGRGQGLGCTRDAVEALDGTLEVHTELGLGTRVHIDVPVHARAAEVTLVQAGGFVLGVPTRAISGTGNDRDARGLLDLAVEGDTTVRLRRGGARRVDRVVATVEALVTPPPFPINRLPRVTGTTVGPDGTILFVVDPSPP